MEGLQVVSQPNNLPALAPKVASAPINQPTLAPRVVATPQQPTLAPTVAPQPQQPTLNPQVQAQPQGQGAITSVGPTDQAQPFTPKLSVDEFAQTIKQQYPQYADQDNAKLVESILTKYPQYTDRVYVPIAAAQSQPQGDNSLGNLIKESLKFSLGMGLLPNDISTGFGKGVLDTVNNLSQLGQEGLQKLTGVKADTASLNPTLTKPTNTAQKAGSYAEKVAEFFAPAGEVARGAEAVDAGIKGLGLASKYGKAGQLAERVLGLAGRGALEGASTAGVTAAQGGNAKDIENAGLIGLVSPVAGKLVSAATEKLLPGISKALEQTNLRLTPVQKQNLGKDLNEITDYLSQQKIVGNPETRYEKVTQLYDDTEKQLQNFLTKDAAGNKVARSDLIQQLESLKGNYQNERDVLPIEKQIDGMIDTLRTRYPTKIPLDRLNQLKRSTYQNAYNKAGDKVLDSVEHDIGDVLRGNIEQATQGLKINGQDIGEFNQQYGTLIQARKLLKIAASRPQIGLVGKLISSGIGGTLGHAFGSVLGGAAGIGLGPTIGEGLAGTRTRSAIGAGLQTLGDIPGQQTVDAIRNVTLPSLRH